MAKKKPSPSGVVRDAETLQLLEEATASLKRIHEFDTTSLARTEELGSKLSFDEAVEPAQSIVDFFRQVPQEVLGTVSQETLQRVKTQADSNFNRFRQVLEFDPGGGNAVSGRDSLVAQIRKAYDPLYDNLNAVVAYAVPKSADFARLDREFRAILQAATDRTDELLKGLGEKAEEGNKALEAIRKVAEEQGVSQQAYYFKTEADSHEDSAKVWLRRTWWLALGLGVYSLLAMFFHKIPWLDPTDGLESAQLIVSKVLVFATISFVTLLSARNYLSNRHNAVVNRHRENALKTFEALVRAGGADANRDIVLTKASECIFEPQPTGFSRTGGASDGNLSVISLGTSALRQQADG